MDLGVITLLYITRWTRFRRSTASGARKPKEAAFKAACPIVKPSFLKPTRGETPVRSTQACFPPIHPKTKISAGLRVDLPSNGSVKKLTGASFLAEIPARLNTSKRTSLTMSCWYLKPGRFLQCIACSPKESKHALRQIEHNLSTENSGIKRRYLRMWRVICLACFGLYGGKDLIESSPFRWCLFGIIPDHSSPLETLADLRTITNAPPTSSPFIEKSKGSFVDRIRCSNVHSFSLDHVWISRLKKDEVVVRMIRRRRLWEMKRKRNHMRDEEGLQKRDGVERLSVSSPIRLKTGVKAFITFGMDLLGFLHPIQEFKAIDMETEMLQTRSIALLKVEKKTRETKLNSQKERKPDKQKANLMPKLKTTATCNDFWRITAGNSSNRCGDLRLGEAEAFHGFFRF
ncbi:hypothetical protein LXL04_002687 [Taraxacum kok-saghyz]